MSGFSAIELNELPPPEVIEELSFESILEDMKADLIGRDSGLAPALSLESEPLVKLLQVCAYRELILRQRINDASRALMLAYARGADLDHLAALFGVSRQLLHAGDPDAQPPVPPAYEDDVRLRRRVQLSLEGHSTAGPRGSYVYWGLSASPEVKDIDVQSPAPGDVLVTVLSTQGNGLPAQALLDQVRATLNHEDVRPLTDRVTVQSAEIVEYELQATLTLYAGPSGEVARNAAQAAAAKYVDVHHRLGHDITPSGLYAALHQPGVQRVTLLHPAGGITVAPHQAAFCTAVSVTMEPQRDE